ncbi:fructose-bisphosphate aldolase [Oceanidesulfovibrio indonesiensis]|uniref:Fructose-bisphosphate aldolase n=1 Tax=Oceanidesulfovibrio indonesiensis TaxID=54767 RepID=A0A7M3MBI9_9BACT|nr:2-amino-3,7-dideoxy-D-threo-hept-6-ulosonate synthase [Oceanidesulfovibrio indonesiensis]TVM15557.1 fructose-bisphosphate aldolase [Oceanidesulfovibrio indonesiensis]
MIGTTRRRSRLFDPSSGRSVILSLDHGASDGMIAGIENIQDILSAVGKTRTQGVVLNKGLARAWGADVDQRLGLMVQLSGGTKHGLPTYNKSLVCSVPEALRAGADAVCVHVNLGNDLEDRMLGDLGVVTDEAHQLGLPVMAVIYARGGQIVNELDPSLISHSIRLGGELGADLVAVPYSGNKKSFGLAARSCPVPVLVTGGPRKADLTSCLKDMEEALDAGAAGVCVGRNVFQHTDPAEALSRVVERVHGKV